MAGTPTPTTYYLLWQVRRLLRARAAQRHRGQPRPARPYQGHLLYIYAASGRGSEEGELLTPPHPSSFPHPSLLPPSSPHPHSSLRSPPPPPHPLAQAWGKSDFGFPCCWGTLSESFAKLSDSIFFAAADGGAVYVNQYVSAAVHLAYGVRLMQVRPLTSSRAGASPY